MATDRDEQLRQQRELEEIRRSFAEMGARMGSLFEPSDDDDEKEEEPRLALPAPPPAPPPAASPAPPAAAPARPRWWWAGAVALLFLAGTALGWVLPRDTGGSDAPPPATPTPATTARAATPPRAPAPPKTVTSVPKACLDAAELADEVISKLDRNDRDQRLFSALRDYTIASQACRREASP
jgi:hypothetical protein